MVKKIAANEERYIIVGDDEEGKAFYPSLTARMLAGIIDVVLFTILLLIISGFIPWSTPQEGSQLLARIQSGELKDTEEINTAMKHFMLEGGGLVNVFMQVLVSVVFASVYVLPFWLKYSATPGKMLMGMKIVRQDSSEKPSKKQLLLRFLSYPISFMPPGLGFVWIIFNKRKRGWHDYLSGTMVVYKKKPRLAL